jgi:hypothetical protein
MLEIFLAEGGLYSMELVESLSLYNMGVQTFLENTTTVSVGWFAGRTYINHNMWYT